MQWFKKLIRKKIDSVGVVGISFLPHGISIAVCTYASDKTLKLLHCDYVAIKKADDYDVILQQWLIAYQLNAYECHIVLAINDYQRVNIEAPTVPVDEMCKAIRWKVAELIDFSIDEAILDYYPLPAVSEAENTLEVIVCAKTTLQPIINHCIAAGLALKIIDIQETTLRNIATLLPSNNQGLAILYLQKSFGLILIQKNGVIYMARKIMIGYEKLELEHTPVNTIYDEFSLEMDSQAAMLQDDLALEIQRSLDYVGSYYHIGVITELAVIPWHTNTHTLVHRFNTNYGIQAYLLDLSTLINADIVLDYTKQSLCAPVIGATLRQAVHDNSTN